MTVAPVMHNILIIDDDEDDLFLLDNYFQNFDNINVNSINNATLVQEFLSALTPEQMPSLIFLDLNMPRKSGFEVLSELKANERYAHIPVIIFTTSSTQEDRQKAAALQADEFITKAYQFSTFQQSVNTVLKSYRITA